MCLEGLLDAVGVEWSEVIKLVTSRLTSQWDIHTLRRLEEGPNGETGVGLLGESGASTPSLEDLSKHVEVDGARDVVGKEEGRLPLKLGCSVRQVSGQA